MWSTIDIWPYLQYIIYMGGMNVHFRPLSTPRHPLNCLHCLHGTVQATWHLVMSLLPGQSASLHRRHVRTFCRLRWSSGTTLRRLVGLSGTALAGSELLGSLRVFGIAELSSTMCESSSICRLLWGRGNGWVPASDVVSWLTAMMSVHGWYTAINCHKRLSQVWN